MKNAYRVLIAAAVLAAAPACGTFGPPPGAVRAQATPDGFIRGGYDEDGNREDNWFYDYYGFFRAGEPPHPFDYGGYYSRGIPGDDWFYDFYGPESPF